MAKGQKTCPNCSAVMGCRSHKCKDCGHVFIANRLRSTEIVDETPDINETSDVDDNDENTESSPKIRIKKSQWIGDRVTAKMIQDGCLPLDVKEAGNVVSIVKPVILTDYFQPNLICNSLYALVEIDIHAKSISVWDGMVSDGSPSRVISGALK